MREHHQLEQTVLAGGYAYRQLYELIQNGADAILEELEVAESPSKSPKIHIILTNRYLYAANTGAPINREGLIALLNAASSPKRQNQIGRFGLGFKSLLRFGSL